MTRFAVIGNGGWGTAVALLLHEGGHDVTIWGHDAEYAEAVKDRGENFKYLPGVEIPRGVKITADATQAVSGAGTIVNAVPTQWVRGVFSGFQGLIRTRQNFLSLSKGIEIGTLMRPSQVLRDLFPKNLCAILSGPSHAEEVARRCPASVVIGARSHTFARRLQDALTTPYFRVYTNVDPTGVGLAGALKNVIAIAAGIVDGLGFGDNTKAALVTRGLVEITRLATKLGARSRTFAGLAGMGDLITTAFSRHGRNRAVGEKLGKGMRLEKILAGMEMVAEGVPTTRSTLALARRHRVDMPIAREVYEILFEDKSAGDALASLMTRSTKTEM